MPEKAPVIPDYITIHLGPPDSDALNVDYPFFYYIKNIASSELSPTLPESALIANIYARISYALSRIYSENYRGRGYNFDLTNSPPDDPSFLPGKKIYRNISRISDEIFNDYIVRGKVNRPIPAKYCLQGEQNCDGMDYWKTVNLAESGYTPLQILHYFYGNDIGIVQNAPVSSFDPYPGTPLRLGSWGNDVYRVQNYLNEISEHYPAIPKIPIGYGIFDDATRYAVMKFQDIVDQEPDGVVGKATWYLIQYAYNIAKRFSQLFMEGPEYTGIKEPYKREYKIGDSDDFVNVLRFYLNFISNFDIKIPRETVGRVFTPQTRAAVMAFQREYGLPVTGVVDRNTWNSIQQAYNQILGSIPKALVEESLFYPGYFITTGANPKIVRQLQTFLRIISQNDKSIPPVNVDGIYGPATKAAVTAFQKKAGITPAGYVGPLTWSALVKQYSEYISRQK